MWSIQGKKRTNHLVPSKRVEISRAFEGPVPQGYIPALAPYPWGTLGFVPVRVYICLSPTLKCFLGVLLLWRRKDRCVLSFWGCKLSVVPWIAHCWTLHLDGLRGLWYPYLDTWACSQTWGTGRQAAIPHPALSEFPGKCECVNLADTPWYWSVYLILSSQILDCSKPLERLQLSVFTKDTNLRNVAPAQRLRFLICPWWSQRCCLQPFALLQPWSARPG